MFEIRPLNIEDYKGKKYLFRYETPGYYDMIIGELSWKLVYRDFEKSKEKSFEDELAGDWLEKPLLYGAFQDEILIGIGEGSMESWNRRFRISNLLVFEEYRHQNTGSRLLEFLCKKAESLGARMAVLETQSCNIPALRCYWKNGFEIIGFDMYSYSNKDVSRQEVRLELGKILNPDSRHAEEGEDIRIRQERPEDYPEVFALIKEAFSTAEHADGTEQELTEDLRKSRSFVPELSLVAEREGELIGHILFTRAKVGDRTVLALAPLSVKPAYQRKGVGTALIKEGHRIARELGYAWSLVLGSETYYPRMGYQRADEVGITVPEGFPAENFMAAKLREDAGELSGAVTYPEEFGV